MGNVFGCYKTNQVDTTKSPTNDGDDRFTKFDVSDKVHAASVDHSARDNDKPEITEGNQAIATSSSTDTSVADTAPLGPGVAAEPYSESGH